MAYNLNAALRHRCALHRNRLNVKGFAPIATDAKNVATFRQQLRAGLQTRPLCNAFGAVISNGALVTIQLAQKRAFLFKPLRRTTLASGETDRRFTALLLKTAYTYAKELAFRSDAGRTMAPVISTSLISLVITRF